MFSISCDFSIGFWNCSDNVVLFVFHFIIKQIHLLYFCIVNYEKFEDAKKGFSEAINRMTDNTMAKIKETKGTGFFIVCLYMYCRWRSRYQGRRVGIPLTGLTPPLVCVCPKPGPGLPKS